MIKTSNSNIELSRGGTCQCQYFLCVCFDLALKGNFEKLHCRIVHLTSIHLHITHIITLDIYRG